MKILYASCESQFYGSWTLKKKNPRAPWGCLQNSPYPNSSLESGFSKLPAFVSEVKNGYFRNFLYFSFLILLEFSIECLCLLSSMGSLNFLQSYAKSGTLSTFSPPRIVMCVKMDASRNIQLASDKRLKMWRLNWSLSALSKHPEPA